MKKISMIILTFIFSTNVFAATGACLQTEHFTCTEYTTDQVHILDVVEDQCTTIGGNWQTACSVAAFCELDQGIIKITLHNSIFDDSTKDMVCSSAQGTRL